MSKLQLSHILGSSTTRPQQLAFAQECLLYISGSFIIFYNPIVDQQIAYLKHSSPQISCITVSNCQNFLAVCSMPYSDKQIIQDNLSRKISNITIYKLGDFCIRQPTVSITLRGHKYAVDHVAFSPDSQYLITVCNKDGSMFVWDCNTGERLTQNKNSKNINSIKFITEKQNTTVNLVTTSRGSCKIWTFSTPQSNNKITRIKQEELWILLGKTIPFNKKFATKQFIDVCFWSTYILLLTTDGLLCMVTRIDQQQKLQKCIDLMITKTTTMDLYQNTVMCGGDNALVKVVDLQSLTLIRKFPKPPPISKQNISKDYDDNDILNAYQQGQQFPQCIGIKTIGNNKLNQFIATLYSNLTIFIWRPQPQDIIAMRSVITHRASIKSVKILQEFKDQLTFFSTISQDNTLRIWHIYKKCFFNKQSIDIAQLIGIKRNAYCRNLTRIIYMQSEKQVTCISGFCKKSIACIAQKQFLMYSLSNFEVVCHQLLDCSAITLEIKDGIAYIGLQNGKIVLYQVLELQGRLNKIREVQFNNKIKYMKIVADDKSKPFDPIIMVQAIDNDEVILYSLKKSKIIYTEKGVRCCNSAGHHVVLCKSDQTINIYNLAKNKSMNLLSLKHQMEIDQYITNVSCNLLWIVVTTSYNKLIIANFSSAIICTQKFNQKINDLALSDNGQIILVGDYADILIYRLQGSHGYEGMQQQVKKWMEKNDLSWMQGSVWARKKSNIESENKFSGSVVDSIRLRNSTGNSMKLPNIQIVYKTDENDQSIFNPNDILKQAKKIYKQIDGMEKKISPPTQNQQNKKYCKVVYGQSSQKNNNNNNNNNNKQYQQMLHSLPIKKKTTPITPISQQPQSNKNSKKKIFTTKLNNQNKLQNQSKIHKIQKDICLSQKYRSSLVNSVIHSFNSHIQQQQQPPQQKKQIKQPKQSKQSKQKTHKTIISNQDTNSFQYSSEIWQKHYPKNPKKNIQINQSNKSLQLLNLTNDNTKQKQYLLQFKQKLSNTTFIQNNINQLLQINILLNNLSNLQKYQSNTNTNNKIQKNIIINQFNKFSSNFLSFLQKSSSI